MEKNGCQWRRHETLIPYAMIGAIESPTEIIEIIRQGANVRQKKKILTNCIQVQTEAIIADQAKQTITNEEKYVQNA
eukprot:2894147-Amphidinium_carterae.1